MIRYKQFTQEKYLCGLVLKFKVYNFLVFTGQKHVALYCIAQLVLFFAQCTRYFFQRITSIAVGISKDDPLVEIGRLLSCLQLHVFFPTKPQNRYNQLFPNTYFYIALYTRFCGFIGITFNNITFLFKIDHDDGTVNTDYAMRKLDMNHLTIGISSIDIQVDTVLIASSNFVYS